MIASIRPLKIVNIFVEANKRTAKIVAGKALYAQGHIPIFSVPLKENFGGTLFVCVSVAGPIMHTPALTCEGQLAATITCLPILDS